MIADYEGQRLIHHLLRPTVEDLADKAVEPGVLFEHLLRSWMLQVGDLVDRRKYRKYKIAALVEIFLDAFRGQVVDPLPAIGAMGEDVGPDLQQPVRPDLHPVSAV